MKQTMKELLYKTRLSAGFNTNVLKILAISSMFIDHAFRLITVEGSIERWWVHFLGRLAAPIIFYLVAEGHHYTHDKKRYITRLLIFALISHFPYIWYFDLGLFQGTSVMWTLSIGLIALTIASEEKYNILIKLAVIMAALVLAVPANWHYIGVLWILTFGLLRERRLMKLSVFIGIGLLFYVLPGFIEIGLYSSYRLGFLITAPLFFLYNREHGKQTRLTKWGFYVFYPGHLILLYIIKNIWFS